MCSEREQNVFDFSSMECKPLAHPSVVCPFNLSRWERLSLDMPDQDLRNYVLRGLREGFHLRYKQGPLSSATRNNPSAYKHKDVVSEYLVKELKRGSIAGPFKVSPIDNLHFSRFGVIPKSAGSDEFRLILDLSFPLTVVLILGYRTLMLKFHTKGWILL